MKTLQEKLSDYRQKHQVTTERIPLGLPSFDLATGGILRGGFTEVYDRGDAIGKTSVALEYCRQVTKDGIAVYVFIDQAPLPKRVLERHGINTSNLVVAQVGTVTDLVNVITSLEEADLIVIDSMASVCDEDTLDDPTYRTVREFLRRINPIIKKNNTAVLILNQIRSKIKGSQTVGGVTIEQYADLRLDLRSNGLIEKDSMVVGRKIRITLTKKNPPEVVEVQTSLLFDTGFDKYADILVMANNLGVIRTSGPYHYYDNTVLGIGYENSAKAIQERGLFDAIYEKLVVEDRRLRGTDQ